MDEALSTIRMKIGHLHSALPEMIKELEAASVELKELDALEARSGLGCLNIRWNSMEWREWLKQYVSV